LIFNFIFQWIDSIIFFNLILIVLIWISFSCSFCKSYYSFQFNPSIKKLFLFLCQF
jgi:hypothetical protein